MRLRHIALLLLGLPLLGACTSSPAPLPAAPLQWDTSAQMVLVITEGWDAVDGSLQRFERDENGWKAVADAAPIAVGRNGAAWGLGLHPQQDGDGLSKQEGDGRAPAGMFGLGDAFGYAGSAATRMPYLAMSATDYCIDVNGSPLYNRIVDSAQVGEDAVRGSTEPMRRDLHLDGDQRYREGVVIQHNPQNLSGQGSCIFAHLWKTPGEPTAGCTAMAAETMDRLLAWLDPRKQPVLVLLPRTEYLRLKQDWKLP